MRSPPATFDSSIPLEVVPDAKPEDTDPKPGHVIQFFDHPLQVPDPIGIGRCSNIV